MNEIIIIILALLPVIVLLYYIWKKDPIPEPASQLRKAFFYGVMISMPVSIVEMAVSSALFGPGGTYSSLFGATIEAFFVAAIPEECAKWLALWLIIRNNKDFDERFDGIVYAVFVSLGFAAIENVSYLFSNLDSWMEVGVARALLAVPGHYAFGVLMGYYLSMYHFVNKSKYNRNLILIAPIMAHGTYDAIAMSGTTDTLVGSLSTLILIFFCYQLQKHCQERVLTHARHDDNGGHA